MVKSKPEVILASEARPESNNITGCCHTSPHDSTQFPAGGTPAGTEIVSSILEKIPDKPERHLSSY